MLLARTLAEHPRELRADFQRFYGLNLDDMGAGYGYAHAADLAAMLPRESATVRAESPALEWSDRDYLLWSVEYSLRVLRWQGSEDGRKGRNAPKPLPTPAEAAELRARVEATDMGHIAEVLGIDIHEGVNHG